MATSPDDEVHRAIQDRHQGRYQAYRHVVQALARHGSLHPGLDEHKATDLLYAVLSPELYSILCTARGWAPEEFKQWVLTTLQPQLLNPSHRSGVAENSIAGGSSTKHLSSEHLSERIAGVDSRGSCGRKEAARECTGVDASMGPCGPYPSAAAGDDPQRGGRWPAGTGRRTQRGVTLVRRNPGPALRSGLTMMTVMLLLAGCGRSFDDPADARCAAPPVTFGQPVDLGSHQEVAVHFTCEAAVLAGTLYLPKRPGRHPAVVWILAGEQTERLRYGDLVAALVQGGVGFFSYDKRGRGQSQGECCPGDFGHFNLLTADAVGAVNALRSSSDIDQKRIGLVGTSQAGWIVPRAAVDSGYVAFIALASAAILPYDQVKAYVELTGGSDSDKPFPSKEQIDKRMRDAEPSGSDPKPFLEKLTVPALWLYGTADREVPVDQSVALLNQLKGQGKDFTIVTFPGAGHGLLDTQPTAAKAPATFVDWVLKQTRGPGSAASG
jgi:dienelactone hydrolase